MRLQATRGSLPAFNQFGKNPALLFADRFVDFGDGDPFRRSDAKSVVTDQESDRAALRALQRVFENMLAELDAPFAIRFSGWCVWRDERRTGTLCWFRLVRRFGFVLWGGVIDSRLRQKVRGKEVQLQRELIWVRFVVTQQFSQKIQEAQILIQT